MNVFDVTVPQFVKVLGNLESILTKANAFADTKKIEMSVLLQDRLAPDMFPLGRQIQILCDTAKFSAGYLTGTTPPKFEDNEVTYADFQARIAKTKAYLQTISPEQYKGAEERKIELPRQPGQYLTGAEYAITHSIPNFYFHVSMAYAILRNNGVDIGKNDYLGARPFKPLA